MRLFRTLAALLLAAVPFTSATAQTTGFPFVNDLTVNGFFSGSTSCNLVNIIGQPSTFQVTAAPNEPVLLIFSLCPCQGGFVPFPAATCPFPMLQSFDLIANATCFVWTVPGATNTAGVYSISFPPSTSSAPFRFSVQGAVLNTSCSNVLLTQAYDVIV